MAYQLEYAFQEFKKNPIKKQNNLHTILISLLLTAAVICSQFGGAILEAMILGKSNHIQSAASQMVTHLREGMTFDEAVYVFCEEITNEETAN